MDDKRHAVVSYTLQNYLQPNLDLLRQGSYPPTHWAHSVFMHVCVNTNSTMLVLFCACLAVRFGCQYVMCNLYIHLFKCCMCLQFTMPLCLFQVWGSVSMLWYWYFRISLLLLIVSKAFLITSAPQTLQPGAKSPGKSLQSPGFCNSEGMLNVSQHLSYLTLPMSRQSDLLEGSAGMGKRAESLSDYFHGKNVV